MARIVSAESKVSKRRKSNKSCLQGNSEAQTLAGTGQAVENTVFKAFPRVESAGQMQLFEVEKKGPKPGQVSRAISINIQQYPKKNIFYVHSDIQPFKKWEQEKEKDAEVEGEEKLVIGKRLVLVEKQNTMNEVGVFDFKKYGEMIMKSTYEKYGIH